MADLLFFIILGLLFGWGWAIGIVCSLFVVIAIFGD